MADDVQKPVSVFSDVYESGDDQVLGEVLEAVGELADEFRETPHPGLLAQLLAEGNEMRRHPDRAALVSMVGRIDQLVRSVPAHWNPGTR